MKFLAIALTLISFLFAAHDATAQTQKEKDRAAFIANTKLLEKKPLDPNAASAREWAFKWLADTDQVSLVLCTEFMKLVPEKENKFKSELYVQLNFGTAVFKLENPDKKDDEEAATLAGIESVLRTYEVLLAENPKAKNAELDAMIAKRNAGELPAVAKAAACAKK